MKRTANPNLPLRVDDDRSDSYNNSPPPGKPPAALGVNDLDQVGYFGGDLQGQGDSTPRYNRHVLFSHAYDSPEELESLALKRRKQFELKEVLERQMAEKRERKEKEEQMRKLEEAREEEEELRFSVAQSGVSALSSGLSERNFSEGLDFYAGLEALATGSDNVEDNDDSTDALSNLLNSPIHARSQTSLEHSHQSNTLVKQDEGFLVTHKEEREVLLRTMKDQDKEIESLLAKLHGVQEGRQLFVDTVIPISSSVGGADKMGSLFSPVRTNAQIDTDTAPELASSSEYVPLGGSSSTFFYEPSYATSPPKNVVSSNILQSAFGLTSLGKTFNWNQYESRKEEALESFLQAFKEGV